MNLSKIFLFNRFNKSTTIITRRYQSKFIPLIMPRDKKHLLELQKQRRRMKAQALKYVPSHICLQVMGNGNLATGRSLILCTNHTHYVFNCGEGTQRLTTEHHVKLTKIEHVFVTKPTWENIGGIPGLALTIQDTGTEKITLHGPEGTADIIEAMDSFITLDDLAIEQQDTSKQFSDQTMLVTYVSISNPKEPEADEFSDTPVHLDHIDLYDYRFNYNGKRSCYPPIPNKKPAKKLTVPKNRIDSMMAFICKVHPRTGTLNLSKCVELGVTPGPDLGKLKEGEDITLADGRIVRSTDVVSPRQPGPLFIVLECPDEDWIDVIVENPAFLKHQEAVATVTNENDIANYVVHFTPENILQNPKYREWMKKFGSSTEHLIINEQNTGYYSESMFKMQHQLNLVHPTIFPIIGDKQCFVNLNESPTFKLKDEHKTILRNSEKNESTELELQKDDKPVTSSVADNLSIHLAKTLNTVHLRPFSGIKKDVVTINPKQYVEDLFAIDGFLDALADLQTKINAHEKELGDTEEYPKLLFLGTGSSVPNKIRNTSGILLRLNKEQSIILDCGEATLSQIVKWFGETEAKQIVKTVKAIYISHLHADHHIGLIGFIKERQKVTKEPFFLLAPQQISSYLHFYHRRFEPILQQIKLISNRDILQSQVVLRPTLSKEFYETVNISEISTTFVTHCPYAYGVAITLKDGRKICYSGDTIPCDNMQKLAQDCFLLIHEATMEDGLENEASVKRHSTISQAVKIGLKANAGFTLLTHFSQRYSKIPLLPDRQQVNLNNVGIAFDFMQVSLSELTLLPLFYPCLEIMFSEFRAVLDERAEKRERAKEHLDALDI